jgi:hypothetical protein
MYVGDITLPTAGTFLEKMQRLKDELQQGLEQQKSRINNECSQTDLASNLHQLMQMIREANSISNHLNKQTVLIYKSFNFSSQVDC